VLCYGVAAQVELKITAAERMIAKKREAQERC
jgi:hypothetical protein